MKMPYCWKSNAAAHNFMYDLWNGYLKVARMSELLATVFASKPALIIVDQHVVVKAVLASKCCFTNKAHKWLDT